MIVIILYSVMAFGIYFLYAIIVFGIYVKVHWGFSSSFNLWYNYIHMKPSMVQSFILLNGLIFIYEIGWCETIYLFRCIKMREIYKTFKK